MTADRPSDAHGVAYKPSLGERLRYRFDAALARGTSVVIGWLGMLTLLVVVIAAAVIWVSQLAGVGGAGRLGVFESLWQALFRVVDAGTFVGDTTWPARILGFVVTLAGIFLAGSLIGLIANAVDQRIEELRKGRSRVLERGHVLILGWSDRVGAILEELVVANESEKGAAVVVLANQDKSEMEDTLRTRVPELGTTSLVCRTGDPTSPSELDRVNLAGCHSVLVVNGEGGDAAAVNTVLAVRANNPGFPAHVVTEVRDPATGASLRSILGDRVVVVSSDVLIAEVTAQACRQRGLSQVFRDLLDFDGDEIYFDTFPSLAGSTFGQARVAFETSSIIGVLRPGGDLMLNPPSDMVIAADDEIVGVAGDDSEFVLGHVAAQEVPALAGSPGLSRARHILIVGWSQLGARVLRELDEFLDDGSSVMVVTHDGLIDGDQVQAEASTTHAALRFEELQGGPESILSIDTDGFDKVVLLGYRDALESADADARTLLTVLALRSRHPLEGPHSLQIVAEVLDSRSIPIAASSGVDDFVVSEELTSLMLAQLSSRHELFRVFEDLFDLGGSSVQLHPATEYRADQPVTWGDIVGAAGTREVCAIGYRSAASGQVRMNPPKSSRPGLGASDEIVVIAG